MAIDFQHLLPKPTLWSGLDKASKCLAEIEQHLENTTRSAELLEFCYEHHFPISDNTLKKTHEIYTGLVTDIFLITQTQCEKWLTQNPNEAQLACIQSIQQKADSLREVIEKILRLASDIAKPSEEKEKLKAMLDAYKSHLCIKHH